MADNLGTCYKYSRSVVAPENSSTGRGRLYDANFDLFGKPLDLRCEADLEQRAIILNPASSVEQKLAFTF